MLLTKRYSFHLITIIIVLTVYFEAEPQLWEIKFSLLFRLNIKQAGGLVYCDVAVRYAQQGEKIINLRFEK